VSVAAYRIVQEALTNVVKHARATRCRVDLARTPGGLRLTVEDDGDGFDVTRVTEGGSPKGLGLIGIRERAAQLGGTLRVESEHRGGTRLVVDLPVPMASESASSSGEVPQSLALPSET
jgi:signal transduction histidine kinase